MGAAGSDDEALLGAELRARWRTDDRGRLVRTRTDDARPTPPLLAVATDGATLVWAASTEVPDATVARLASVLADEQPGSATLGWEPAAAPRLLAALGEHGPVETGPSYVVATPPPVPAGPDLRTSADPDAAAVRALVPEADRALTRPWVVALVDGEAAAVCETARDAPHAVEAGVWTYEAHRRRGLAIAVVARWAGMVAGRTAFYSTSADNHASQGVARRLGLRPLGHWWQVRP